MTKEIKMMGRTWTEKQYNKIQDYVINNKLYKGQKDNLSHADILINKINQLNIERSLKMDKEIKKWVVMDLQGKEHFILADGWRILNNTTVQFRNGNMWIAVFVGFKYFKTY